MHSKLWLFDDQYLITGSANCNRRGYSHDSELNVGLFDEQMAFVRDARIRLWLSRLNVEFAEVSVGPEKPRKILTPEDLKDFLGAVKYWAAPTSAGLPIESACSAQEIEKLAPQKHSDGTLMEIAGLVRRSDGRSGEEMANLVGILGRKLIWDIVVDPSGTSPRRRLAPGGLPPGLSRAVPER